MANTDPSTLQASPTYRKLFGDTDYYSVDSARTVLSPAAYFVQLLDLIQAQIQVDTSVPGATALNTRRPGLYDKIKLNDEDTNTEIPKLDIVIDLLQDFLTANNISFDDLTSGSYPFDLPYDKEMAAIHAYLKESNTSLSEIWYSLAAIPGNTLTATQSNSIAMDLLGISPAFWQFVSTSKTDEASIQAAYGITGSPDTELSSAKTMMAQCGITRDQLDELIYQDLSTGEITSGIQSQFYINVGTHSPLSIEDDNIQNVHLDRLDRIHRFIRLANAIEWTFTELDWALYCYDQAFGGQGISISKSLDYLGWIQKLKNKGLDHEQACALVYRLRDRGMKNGPTPFQMVFNNPNIEGIPAWPTTTPYTTSDANPLAAVLGIDHQDLQCIVRIIDDYAGTAVNKEGLSVFYRISLLPKITGLSIEDIRKIGWILPWWEGYKPFTTPLSFGAVKDTFIEEFIAFGETLSRLPLNLSQVQYLVTAATEDPSVTSQVPTGDDLTNFVTEFKQAFDPTLLTTNTLGNALTRQLRSELIASVKGMDKAAEILASLNSYVDAIVLELFTQLGSNKVAHDGIVLLSEISGTLQTTLISGAVTPTMTEIGNVTGTAPSLSDDWITTLEALLSKTLQAQEKVTLDQIAKVTKVPIASAGGIKYWLEAYFKGESSGTWLTQTISTLKGDASDLDSLINTLCRFALLIRNFSLSESESKHFSSVFVKTDKQQIAFSSVAEIGQYRSLTQAFNDSQNVLLGMIENTTVLSDDAVGALTGWDETSLKALIAITGFTDLKSVSISTMNYLQQFFHVEKALGINTSLLCTMINLSDPGLTFPNPDNATVATGLFGGLQAKLGPGTSALIHVQDRLKSALRDRLVALVMKKMSLQHKRDLFNYFLIDMEVDGTPITSKLREGISAAQLYIQRCINHLEPGVSFTAVTPSIQVLWKWMYSFSQWEANREVFLFPENYIEPELRQTTSPEFENFLTKVKQANGTDTGAYAKAYTKFFQDIVRAAAIKPITIARLFNEGSTTTGTFMMVGNSEGDPQRFYYRLGTFDATRVEWGYWKKIDTHIAGSQGEYCISCKFVFGSWHIFWQETMQSQNAVSDSGSSYSQAKSYTICGKYAVLGSDAIWGAPQLIANVADSDNVANGSPGAFPFLAATSAMLTVSYTYINSGTPTNFAGELSGVVGNTSTHIWQNHSGGPVPLGGSSFQLRTDLFKTLPSFINRTDGISVLLSAGTQTSLLKNFTVYGHPISNYYWELFFHAPFLIAHELQNQQQFREAKKWYEYVFNPQETATAADTGMDRFWRFQGLDPSQNALLASELSLSELQEQISNLATSTQVFASEEDPFDPQAIARLRPIAYQKTLFMHYYRNLIDWGDQCMVQNTRSSINEAEMIYVMAADLLGSDPIDLGSTLLRESQNYNGQLSSQWTKTTATDANGHSLQNITFLKELNGFLWAGTNGQGLWRSKDGGNTWSNYSIPMVQGLDPNAKTDFGQVNFIDMIYQTELSEYMILFQNGSTQNVVTGGSGQNYSTAVPSGNSSDAIPANCMADYNGWRLIGTTQGAIKVWDRNYDTFTWYDIYSGGSGAIEALTIFNGQLLFSLQGVYYSIAIPATFPTSPVASNILSAKGTLVNGRGNIKMTDEYIVAGASTVIYSEDGSTWTTVATEMDTVDMAITDDLWILVSNRSGTDIDVYVSYNQGAHWTPSSTKFYQQTTIPTSVHIAGNIVYLSAYSDASTWRIWKSLDNGFSWSVETFENEAGSSFTLGNPNIVSAIAIGDKELVASQYVWSKKEIQYFGVPQNLLMLSYWDQVRQRLYDINHELTLEGTPDVLPLFSGLYGSGAQGLSSAALEQEFGPDYDKIPYYRFSYMIEKAKSACSDLRSLGSSLLSALEQQDAGALANLYLQNEQTIQQIQLDASNHQLSAANYTLTGLQQSKSGIQERKKYYQDLINKGLNSDESAQKILKIIELELTMAKEIPDVMKIIGYLEPSIFGLADGGMKWGDAIGAAGDVISTIADYMGKSADISGLSAEHSRRKDGWQHEVNVATSDITEIESQIDSAQSQVNAALSALKMVNTEIQQKQKVAQFYLQKFTNEELYQWFVAQLGSLYLQAYQQTLDLAVLADNARKFEQNVMSDAQTLLTGGYWNNLHQGLMAGEKLQLDLQRMENHYMDNNFRPLFITKEISLSELDHSAFLDLITNGNCSFDLKEWHYDYDFPGQYNRRIARVEIYVELEEGVSGTVNATLTQISNKIVATDDSNGQNAAQYLLNSTTYPLTANNPSLVSNIGVGQSVVMAQGPSDPVMLLIYNEDSRYLPFEGTGAVSSWMLELPDQNRIARTKIKDIKMNISYTAYQGKTAFKSAVTTALGGYNGAQALSLRNQFPDAWNVFVDQTTPAALTFDLDTSSWHANGETYTVNSIKMLPVSGTTGDLPNISVTIPGQAKATKLSAPPVNTFTTILDSGTSIPAGLNGWGLAAASGSGGGKKEVVVPETLDDILLFIDYSISFKAS